MSTYELFKSNTKVSAQDAKEVVQIAQQLTRRQFLERAIPLMARPAEMVIESDALGRCYLNTEGSMKSLIDGITDAFINADDIECCESFYMGVHCFIIKRADGVEIYAPKSEFPAISEMEVKCLQRRKIKEEIAQSWHTMAFWADSFGVPPAKAIRHFCHEHQSKMIDWRIPLQVIAMEPSKLTASHLRDRLIEICREWDIANLSTTA